VNDTKWTKKEKLIAREAFHKAYKSECMWIADNLKNMVNEVSCPDDLWEVRNYLSKTLKNIEKKYDFRYSILILVLAQLMKDGWIEENELIGLSEDKISKIINLAKGQYL
jgi:hypothetical protein